MFTKIRVVTSLLLVLLVFGVLQLASGSLFFKALSDDKKVSIPLSWRAKTLPPSMMLT